MSLQHVYPSHQLYQTGLVGLGVRRHLNKRYLINMKYLLV